jgi:hypothetical protein
MQEYNPMEISDSDIGEVINKVRLLILLFVIRRTTRDGLQRLSML